MEKLSRKRIGGLHNRDSKCRGFVQARIECLRCVCLVALLGVLQTPSFAAEAAGGFKLQDFLGRRWANEAVRFNLRPEQLGSAKAGHALGGPDNREVTYQFVP